MSQDDVVESEYRFLREDPPLSLTARSQQVLVFSQHRCDVRARVIEVCADRCDD